MKHEWRKHDKQIYLPKALPTVIVVPQLPYFTLSGTGNPNPQNIIQRYDNFNVQGSVAPVTETATAITVIDYAPETDEVTLTWRSRPGEEYTVEYSLDMSDWSRDLDGGIPADAGEATTKLFDLEVFSPEVAAEGAVFFRVEKN